jgi:hypothetical protein
MNIFEGFALRVHFKWVQVLRLTGLCLTIEIEEKLFDDLQKLRCLTQILFNVEAAIVKH